MWTLSDTTIWFQTISSTLLGTKMLKSRAQNLQLIVANSCLQIFIIIIAGSYYAFRVRLNAFWFLC